MSGMDAENFHTLALDNVPIFGAHNRTSAYRFVTLVDVSFPSPVSQLESCWTVPWLDGKVMFRSYLTDLKI